MTTIYTQIEKLSVTIIAVMVLLFSTTNANAQLPACDTAKGITAYTGFGLVQGAGVQTYSLMGFIKIPGNPVLIESGLGTNANHLATDYDRDRVIFTNDNSSTVGELFAYYFSGPNMGMVVSISSPTFLSSLMQSDGAATYYNGKYYIFDDKYDGGSTGVYEVTFDVTGMASSLTMILPGAADDTDTTVPIELGDMVVSSAGIMYVLERDDGVGNGELWTADLNDLGAGWSLLSVVTPEPNQLFFDNDQRLLTTNGTKLYQLDPTTGAVIDTYSGANNLYFSDLASGGAYTCGPPPPSDLLPECNDNTGLLGFEAFAIVNTGTTSAKIVGWTSLSSPPVDIVLGITPGDDANHLAIDSDNNRLIYSDNSLLSGLYAYYYAGPNAGISLTFDYSPPPSGPNAYLADLLYSDGGGAFYNGKYYFYDDDASAGPAGLYEIPFNLNTDPNLADEVLPKTRIAEIATWPRDNSYGPATRLGGIAISDAGILYALESTDGTPNANGELWSIDLNNPGAGWGTPLGIPAGDAKELFFDNQQRLFTLVGTDFVQIDPSDASTISTISGNTEGSVADFATGDQIACTIILPIELLFFTAEAVDNNAYLTWATATETNNAYFEVQQSTDGVNWTVISEVAGNGTTNTRHNYAYTHTNVSGVVFYRLKQVDDDGTASYSNIEVLNFASEALRLFPNPANDVLNITLGTGNNGRGAERIRDIVIYDMMGRVIQRINSGDSQSERIDISVLPPAMYMLGITTSDNTIRYEKFVKTNR